MNIAYSGNAFDVHTCYCPKTLKVMQLVHVFPVFLKPHIVFSIIKCEIAYDLQVQGQS